MELQEQQELDEKWALEKILENEIRYYEQNKTLEARVISEFEKILSEKLSR